MLWWFENFAARVLKVVSAADILLRQSFSSASALDDNDDDYIDTARRYLSLRP